jgi:SAM-dependent methyltransferase
MPTIPVSAQASPHASLKPRNGKRRPPERGAARFHEETLIRRFFRQLPLTPEHKVLDVACGYGRKMAWLREEGLTVEGVDINPDLVAATRDQGFHCMTLDDFEATDERYDAMLMAHIVEHFTPPDLLVFLDGYLDRLKVGGYLLISTPLDWANFYADFDHTKTYHPKAFLSVFSLPQSQVQYHSNNRLRLIDLGLRRYPKNVPDYEDLYSTFYRAGLLWTLRSHGMRRFWRALYKITGGVFGAQTTGWVGLFEKMQ